MIAKPTTSTIILIVLGAVCGCSNRDQKTDEKPSPLVTATAAQPSANELSHEQTLAWIKQHRAWRRARKTKEIWARAVTAEEIGKEFQTADRAVERAKGEAWLCVGIANEPWFQSIEKIESKYDRGAVETRPYAFDDKLHEYQCFHPKPDVLAWAARVQGPQIAGFSIRPGYDPATPLHSKSGGYVVMGDSPDPYEGNPDDIWLVQQPLFESTYEQLEK